MLDDLRTIEEVVAYQLRRLRGDNSQSDMADILGIPLRTYNALENGQIPRPETRKIIAQKLGITETMLFLDPDLSSPTAEEVSETFARALQDEIFRAELTKMLRAYMPTLRRLK